MPDSIHVHEGSKYLRQIHPADGAGKAIYVDVYAVLEAFNVTCPARAHAIEKLLAAGLRGKGTEYDDLIGATAAVARAAELQTLRQARKKQP